MNKNWNKYDELEKIAFGYSEGMGNSMDENSEEFIPNLSYYDNFDYSLTDIDFSDFRGNYKTNLSKLKGKLKTKVIAPQGREVVVEGRGRDLNLPKYGQKVIAPSDRKVIVEGKQKPQVKRKKDIIPVPQMMKKSRGNVQTSLEGGENYNIRSNRGPQKISKVVVPDDKKVIIQGVSDFILSQDKTADSVKNIGYYKGKKLKELVLTFNNNSALDFELELFNPSMPLDYLYSTSLNLNDKIQVAGGEVSYTDVLFNILANSTMIPNAKFVFAGPSLSAQKVQPIIMKNKSIEGKEKVYPFNLDLQVDTMQVQSDIVFFDFFDTINRPFIPDGMDIMSYKILPGMTVTMAFFYDQISLKKLFRKEARYDKGLL